jgi:ABC-2 type transport system ATP-binding protein
MAIPSIKVEDVSMMFNLSRQKEERLKEYVINLIKGKLFFDEFWALKNVSFEINKGESLGIIGVNGSGKSTLLKIISGIMKPTKGSVATYGTIAPLIEMGGGFDRDLTAKENIYLVGAMHGHSRTFIKKQFDSIIDFSELHDFVDVPLRNYSSGMISRLGFAIATLVNADILIADEVLSVGDMKFREKCEARIREMVGEGTTVLFVSHSMEQIQKICQKALWLDKGEMKMFGPAKEVCNAYRKAIMS